MLEEALPYVPKTTQEDDRPIMDHLFPAQGILDANILSKQKLNLSALSVAKVMLFKKFGKAKNSGAAAPIRHATSQSPGEIEETPCEKCNAPYLLHRVDKEGNVTLICNNKSCGFKKAGESTEKTVH